jgi:primosomal protein N' (replication factor Y)
MQPRLFVDVILPLALPKLYTYSLPEEMEKDVNVGARVVIQFGKKKLYSAIVYKIHGNAPEAYQTKDIIQIIDEKPLVSDLQFKLWDWLSSYYMCTLGEVMKAALPSGLKMESETLVRASDGFGMATSLSESEALIVSMIDDGKSLSIQQLVSKVDVPNPMGVIKSLLDKKVLTIYESIDSPFIPKFEIFVRLHSRLKVDEDINRTFGQLERAPAQQKVLLAFLTLTAQTQSTFTSWVIKKELMEKADVSESVFKAMVEKNIFEVERREVSRLDPREDINSERLILSEEQTKTLKRINDDFKDKQVVLLHGVTSSGKTEMYINLIAQQLKNGRQVLYLLPEIALTAQIINRLKRFFGNRVGVYHSKFSDNQRVEVYQSLLNDGSDPSIPSYDIILGVRSSVFLPFKRLGLVIVDEEHENTFKQFNPAPRYHARDSAIVLAGIHQAKVLLGTATPSLESYYNAQVGKYGFATITQRYRDIELPNIEVVDTLMARKKKLMKSIFSPKLLDAIGETLEKGEQVILFQNRRGYSPFIECEECAWVPQCKNCAVSLTYHKNGNQLVCHYCSYTIQNLSSCLACGSAKLTTKGFGTEKVEDELALFFPNATIERMDSDTTRSRFTYERIISDFEQGKINILVGTQMITKGLDFDRVSLVGILNADNMLNFPDFRAHERSFQLMAQVSGRAGRKFKRGTVIIQTANPNHPIIQHVVTNNFEQLFKEQLLQRKDFSYPPYFKLIRISLRHRNIKTVQVAANQLAANLRARLKDRVLGPEEPLISRIQNLYIEDILIKLERNLNLPKAKAAIQEEINRIKEYKPFGGIFISPDVDPM